MADMTVRLIKGRIREAEASSPIAVFELQGSRRAHPDWHTTFEAIFASTIIGRNRIVEGKGLIGVYDHRDVERFDNDILALRAEGKKGEE